MYVCAISYGSNYITVDPQMVSSVYIFYPHVAYNCTHVVMYSTILAVSSVLQVMEAYTGGLKAMKAALQAQPLSKEELEDVMDQLQDVSACAH